MINLKRFVLFPVLVFSISLFSACGNLDKSVDYEVVAKAESGDAGALTNSAQHITDKEMLRMAVEQTGVELDAGAVDFDESHIFQVSLYENGCGYLLEDLIDKGGALQFMFELTPVVENGEDPEDVTCTEAAVPTTFFIKTEAVDFSSLEIYGSGEKIQSE
ncbi:hypothetical protein [Salinicoccus halodurans]|uniref:Lipoprotein n=1 Tax=Salinicoccus halodurans TaxID=407035 RepID=A0A0F7D3Y2_9STAP|nr:hypothetical protein [Salinicoccus halodurans]AKG73280.1 hypothetical protein AAT16_03035 [Salinicoccus halodurans]SFK82948.1 hypothetical protein SAMN05216235_1916 [Salinicoccus halodurans]